MFPFGHRILIRSTVGAAEPEMEPHIVIGKITPAASDFCDLRLSSGLNFHAGADGVAIGRVAF